jgi:cell division protein FtsN
MTRDYAKKQLSPNRYTKSKKQLNYKLFPIVTVILFFIFTIILAYYGKQHLKIPKSVKTPKTELEKPAAKTSNQSKHPAAAEFDFYTLLPQKNPIESALRYEIEITTAEDAADLEPLRTKLQSLGYNGKVTSLKMDDELHLFRLTLGPYKNKLAAQNEQSNLKHNNITCKVKKINSEKS